MISKREGNGVYGGTWAAGAGTRGSSTLRLELSSYTNKGINDFTPAGARELAKALMELADSLDPPAATKREAV